MVTVAILGRIAAGRDCMLFFVPKHDDTMDKNLSNVWYQPYRQILGKQRKIETCCLDAHIE
jgi:hypothetical protein